MADNNGSSAHQRAIDQYQNREYEAAASTFKSLRRSQQSPLISESLHSLLVEADLALCRFRALTTANTIIQKEVLYREAIVANEVVLSKVRQCHHDLLSVGVLATISIVWIHTFMDNLRMARHRAWDTLQWAISVSFPDSEPQTYNISESFLLLSHSVEPMVLRKFRHVFDVLDLVQGKNYTLIIERQRSNYDPSEDLTQKESAVLMLVRRHLGLATTLSNNNAFAISLKLQKTFHAIDEPQAQTKESIKDLCALLDHSKSSDLNLLGFLQTDYEQAFRTYTEAFKCLRPNENNLRFEIVFNMADCLARLGHHHKAKDLFLWLHGTKKRFKSTNSIAIATGDSVPATDLLWRAFISATLDDDPVSTLAVADLLHREKRSKATLLVLIFSLHQAGRPSLARKHSRREHSIRWAFSGEEAPDPSHAASDCGVMAACFHNNRGQVFATNGNVPEAIQSFERASAALVNLGPRYLHPFYNLTLLLWASGQSSRAIELWKNTRLMKAHCCKCDVEDELNYTAPKCEKERRIGMLTPFWLANMEGGLHQHYVTFLDCLVKQYRAQQVQDQTLENLVLRAL